MTAWQPIDTAPTDGTEIIATDGVVVFAAQFKGDEGSHDAGWWYANTGPGDYYADLISPPPTWWAPLPEPPPSAPGPQGVGGAIGAPLGAPDVSDEVPGKTS